MATPQSAERAWSDTIGDVHINETAPPPEEISRRAKHLHTDTVHDMLTQAAQIQARRYEYGGRCHREKEQNRFLASTIMRV